ncbi:MAG: amidohydrolase [Muribaculaceae bacterium]|nr:amidohydrolase [Muribaculaceae bacterium]
MKLIDAHAHVVQCIAGTGSQGELRPCGGGRAVYATGNSFQILPPEFGEYDAAPEALLRVMDAHGVEKAVLLQGNYFGFQNLYTYEAVRKYPDRFAGAASYDPFSAQADQIKTHLFDELGFKIVKFEVSSGSGLMANHPPVDLDGEVMHQCYRHAADRDLIFVIDIGKPRSVSWQVDALSRAIARYPGMRFVVCHLLSPQLGDGELLRRSLDKLALPNVWFDLAALCLNSRPEEYPYPTARGYVRDAVDIVGADRLLWGSDMPSAMTRDTYQHFIDFIAEHPGLDQGDKERILWSNAARLFFSP